MIIDDARPGRPAYSAWLARAVGHVALEASQCEDTLGELVVLGRGLKVEECDTEWWTSGERLAGALVTLDDPVVDDIADVYGSLLTRRHVIVHGLWVEQADA